MNKKYYIAMAMIITVLTIGVGVYSIQSNPIIEGKYIDFEVTRFLVVGDFLSIEVNELEDRGIKDDIKVVLTTLENNVTTYVKNREFINSVENGIEIVFDLIFWEYTVETPLYNINDDVTFTTTIHDINITVATGITKAYWYSVEELQEQQIVYISIFLFTLNGVMWIGTATSFIKSNGDYDWGY